MWPVLAHSKPRRSADLLWSHVAVIQGLVAVHLGVQHWCYRPRLRIFLAGRRLTPHDPGVPGRLPGSRFSSLSAVKRTPREISGELQRPLRRAARVICSCRLAEFTASACGLLGFPSSVEGLRELFRAILSTACSPHHRSPAPPRLVRHSVLRHLLRAFGYFSRGWFSMIRLLSCYCCLFRNHDWGQSWAVYSPRFGPFARTMFHS